MTAPSPQDKEAADVSKEAALPAVRSKSVEELAGEIHALIGSGRGMLGEEAADKLHTQVLELVALGETQRRELESIKTEIEKLLGLELREPNLEFVAEVVEGAEQRRERKSDTEVMDKLANGEALESQERRVITSMLNRRDWGEVYTGLKAHDAVINFSVPADKFLAIKHLNDDVFGPSHTDEILIAGRNILQEEFIKALESRLPESSPDELKQLVLLQDYKNSVFKVESAMLEKISGLTDVIEEVNAKVKEKMDKFVLRKVAEYRNTPEGETKATTLDEFASHFAGEENAPEGAVGYRLGFGWSTVESKGPEADNLDITTSVARSFVMSRAVELNRLVQEFKLPYAETKAGGDYKTVAKETLQLFSTLARELKAVGSIAAESGEAVPIFDAAGHFNKDLIRDIRKDKFKPGAQAQESFNKIVLYYRMLNLMDFIKPHTKEEISGGAVTEKITRNKKASELINTEGRIDDPILRQETDRLLRSTEKSERYTSDSEFNRRATAMETCTLIGIDLLDVGVDQLLHYEELLSEAARAGSEEEQLGKFQENILRASDKFTAVFREFREGSAEVVLRHLDKNIARLKESGGQEAKIRVLEGEVSKWRAQTELLTAKVGGDELTLALDSSLVDDELLFDLKSVLKDTGARIVTAKAERANDGDRPAALKEAMQRVERGTEIAKQIEDVLRKLNQKGVGDKLRGLDELDKLFVVGDKGKVSADFAVVEEAGEFIIKIRNQEKSLRYNDIQEMLTILNSGH